MKFFIAALILGLCASALVSAKSHHRKRDQDDDSNDEELFDLSDFDGSDNDNNYDSSDDDDDDGDDEDLKAFECAIKLSSCYESLETYGPGSNITEVAGHVRQASIRTACTDLTKAGQCAVDVALTDECAVMPDYFKTIIHRGVEALNFVCVEKIDEVEEHWECLLNVENSQELEEECEDAEQSLQQCNSKPLVDCTKKVFDKSPYCRPGAVQLVSEVVNKVLKILPHCSEQTKFKKFLKRILRKK